MNAKKTKDTADNKKEIEIADLEKEEENTAIKTETETSEVFALPEKIEVPAIETSPEEETFSQDFETPSLSSIPEKEFETLISSSSSEDTLSENTLSETTLGELPEDRTYSNLLNLGSFDLLNLFIRLGISLSSEKDLDVLLEKILDEAIQISNCDGGTFYLTTENNKVIFSIVKNIPLNIHMGGTSDEAVKFSPLTIYDEISKEPNHNNVVTHSVITGEIINIADVYNSHIYNFSGIFKFDEEMNYKTVSMLTLPMKDHLGEVNAVLQLINAKDKNGNFKPFDVHLEKLMQALAGIASMTINRNLLILAHRQMMEAFIEVIARAIDDKSPYTGAHCQRVPVITRMLAAAADEATGGPFSSFKLSETDWYALHLASWMHDCGKITTPDYLVDKATKLETVYNRIHEIRAKFEILIRDAKINYLQKRLKNEGNVKELTDEYLAITKQLEKDFSFIAKLNIGDKLVTAEDIKELNRIAGYKYVRHFDRLAGLSWQEIDRTIHNPPSKAPAVENLLQDAPDQFFGEFNRGELHNLSIKKGTLTDEEYRKIQDHVKLTIDILESLPFPKDIKNVTEYAGAHHERVDGKGYPKGLTKEEMSIPARIMAISDIYEALTAHDRPYKLPKKLSEVLSIMYDMKKSGHIDAELFDLFLTSGVYKDYADIYISPDQLDNINIEDYLN